MSTPTFRQWMDYLDTGTQPEPKLAFNTTLYPTFLNTNFALHRWPEIYISKFAWICQRLKPFFCARFHSHSPWAPVSAPFARSLPESKWVYSATIMFVCFRLWTLFVCLFVCLFGEEQPAARCKCGRPFEFCPSILSEAAARIDGWKRLQPSTPIVRQWQKS